MSKIETAHESAVHMALASSVEDSLTTLELKVRLPNGQVKMVLLARYKNLPRENSIGALIRARELNPQFADEIYMSRVDKLYVY